MSTTTNLIPATAVIYDHLVNIDVVPGDGNFEEYVNSVSKIEVSTSFLC